MSEWNDPEDDVPKKNELVLVWLEGVTYHTGVHWRRDGYYLMPYHGGPLFSERMKDAMKHLDADRLWVVGWQSLPKPPALED